MRLSIIGEFRENVCDGSAANTIAQRLANVKPRRYDVLPRPLGGEGWGEGASTPAIQPMNPVRIY